MLMLLMVVVLLWLLYRRADQGDVGHCGMVVERQYYEDASVLLVVVARWV